MRHRSMPRVANVYCLLMTAALAGCSASYPFDFAPVSGKVTYADGSPLKAARVEVHFVPHELQAVRDMHPRPATGLLAADGTFAFVGTNARDDGAIAGRHKVVLLAYNADFSPCLTAFDKRYGSAELTPLEVAVAPEGPNYFELKVEQAP